MAETETRICTRPECQTTAGCQCYNPPLAKWTKVWPDLGPYIGCICPPGANITCERADCPRKAVGS